MFRLVNLNGQEWQFDSRESAIEFKETFNIVGFVQPVIAELTPENCPRCKWDTVVPHYNCMYQGKAIGHSKAHCTADACF